jgi:hypothetical protein
LTFLKEQYTGINLLPLVISVGSWLGSGYGNTSAAVPAYDIDIHDELGMKGYNNLSRSEGQVSLPFQKC